MGIIKTTLSPLTNTTSLVSIILVILLIAVFRISGGGISTNGIREIGRKDLLKQNEEVKKTNYNIKRNDSSSGVIEMDANEVNKIFGVKRNKPKEQKPKDDKESSFDSIEKSLGLR